MFLLGTFYLFASFLVMTCISVIFSKNPVNSVLFLVLAFLNSTFLFILIGAEFVGIILANETRADKEESLKELTSLVKTAGSDPLIIQTKRVDKIV